MRIAVLSDIHANLEAFRSVIDSIRRLGFDQVFCAGDIVGYGASPRECVDLCYETGLLGVTGNHETAVLSEAASLFFNRIAKTACAWTATKLEPYHKAYLAALPMTREFGEARFSLAHADITLPGLFDYVLGYLEANRNLQALAPGTVLFIGHSHVPFLYNELRLVRYDIGEQIHLPQDMRVLVNVGSVGQPRDGDPRASFAAYDTDNRVLTMHRVWYDVDGACARIKTAGLPSILGDRLQWGR